MAAHVPVMLAEVLRHLALKEGARVVDATLGIGGHAEAILRRIGAEGRLVGIDRDADMLTHARGRLAPWRERIELCCATHSELGRVARDCGLERADAILLDLGVCSAQLDDPERGLGFRSASERAPLDMRLDRRRAGTAADLLAKLDENGLVELLRAGDVPAPRRVARALRAAEPIETTGGLLAALESVRLPRRHHHPATLVFQALRMAVNDEAHQLESALEAAVELLAPGGRLVVLSYHSGDDRRVKHFLRREERGCICPPRLPECACGRTPRLGIVARGEVASEREVRLNPRARSARLRGAERW